MNTQTAVRAAVTFVATLIPCVVFGQTVYVKDGNVFLRARNTIQITSSGFDSDPSLSTDKGLVVFVRRTPLSPISTGAGSLDTNELWVADTTARGNARRIFAGRDVDAKSDEMPLAGFSSPKFSLDARRVFFLAQLAATSPHVVQLELKTGQIRFLCRGVSIEVLNSGPHAGSLIVLKDIPKVTPGHVLRYWLLDQNGNDVGEIGEKEADVRAFKNGRF